MNMVERNKLDRLYSDSIGILVCRISYDSDQQKNILSILESYVGKLGRSSGNIDRKINAKSKYIRMYKNIEADS